MLEENAERKRLSRRENCETVPSLKLSTEEEQFNAFHSRDAAGCIHVEIKFEKQTRRKKNFSSCSREGAFFVLITFTIYTNYTWMLENVSQLVAGSFWLFFNYAKSSWKVSATFFGVG